MFQLSASFRQIQREKDISSQKFFEYIQLWRLGIMEETSISSDIDALKSPKKRPKYFFWQKWALAPDDEKDDKLLRFEIEERPEIREVVREFESKNLGKKTPFNEIRPKNSSIKRWIRDIIDNYPSVDENEVDDLLNSFRSSLYPRSKERYKNIVGILLLNNTLLLFHCKRDISLVESEDKVFPAEQILSSKNVYRSAIIRNEDGKFTFAAFEYNKKWSKGHAEFWGVDPDIVNWDALAQITLNIEVESFHLPIQLPVEPEIIDEMVRSNHITPTGRIQLGKIKGTITSARVFRRNMDFNDFLDYYVSHKERLEEYRNKFNGIIKQTKNGKIFDYGNTDQYFKYEDSEEALYEITLEGRKTILDKCHPRYVICFFTKMYPRIKPSEKFLNRIFEAIFENRTLEVWHAGERTAHEPISIGSLKLYNEISVHNSTEELSNRLLNLIQDATSRKARLIMQYIFCELWKNNLRSNHIPSLFNSLIERILIHELNHEFSHDGLLETEGILEFKSSDDFTPKIARFVNDQLIPTIEKYIQNDRQTRFAILYGVEDSGYIAPITRLKSDMISDIEKRANEELNHHNVRIIAKPIPFGNGVVLLILLVPLKSQIHPTQVTASIGQN